MPRSRPTWHASSPAAILPLEPRSPSKPYLTWSGRHFSLFVESRRRSSASASPSRRASHSEIKQSRGWQMMKEAVVVSVVRTAVGKAPKGTLRYTRPDDLGAVAVKGAVDRVPALDPKEIEDVIIGCAMPEGEQGMNMARLISLRAGLPIEAAAMTVNRYCASGLQTIALAAERIRSGGADVIVAGGEESMSYLPMGGNKIAVNPWLMDNHPAAYMSMGLTAERVAKHYGISREESDQFALASHQKALAAIEGGRFEDEIVPVPVVTTVLNTGGKPEQKERSFSVDEGPRADTSIEALAKLRAVFHAHGVVTAGNSSQT